MGAFRFRIKHIAKSWGIGSGGSQVALAQVESLTTSILV